MPAIRKGLIAKTIEFFGVSKKQKPDKAKSRSAEDLLLNYVDKPKKQYQDAGFSGLSHALDRIADRPRK